MSNRRKDSTGGEEQSREERARALVAQAKEHLGTPRALSLARQALRTDADNVEAYFLLADAAQDPLSRADLNRQALDAAKRALKAQALPELRGDARHLPAVAWRRRARCELGRALEELGLLREAAAHYRRMLREESDDPGRARYALAGVLFELDLAGGDGRAREELRGVLDRFESDQSARWHYDRALFAFRQEGDSLSAQAFMQQALEENPLIAPLLIHPPAVASVAPSTADESEAREYAQARRELWQVSPGALAWMAEIAGAPPPVCDEELLDQDKPEELRFLDEVLARLEADVAERLTADEHEVLRLLEEAIDEGERALLRYACGLWVAYAHSEQPRIRKPAVHAAAIEYVTAQLLEMSRTTQGALAERYGVGASSISRAAQAVDLWLDAALVDGLDVDGDELAEQLAEELVEELAVELGVELDETTAQELRALPVGEDEWQGALRRAPFQVLEPRPHRPMLSIWYEQREGTIVGQEIFGSTAPPHAMLHTLVQAMFSPLAGEPRRPRALRVEDAAVAEQLRRQLEPVGIDVRQGELEGIATLMTSLEQFMAQHSAASYLEEGIDPPLVGSFFHAAACLRRAAPWTFVGSNQVLGLDLEKWGENRLCVSIIGNRADERGLLIFHALDEYLAYYRHAELSAEDGALVGAPVEMLSLIYEAGAELDIRQRREVFKHGWEVVGTEDYPMLYRFDADGGVQPLEANDYRIATVCAEAIAAYCSEHQEAFGQQGRAPLRKLIRLEHGGVLDTVCVIAPHP